MTIDSPTRTSVNQDTSATVAIVTALMFWASRAVVFYADEGEH